MRKNTKLNFMYILIAIPIYFFSTIFVNHFQQHEYVFTDVNNIKKYQVTSNNDASYARKNNEGYERSWNKEPSYTFR